ncbi:hypothetical protein Dtox_1478 [Desulfofarcimen acetoxidans DSM 771]|uniref:Uncharacterized protein n=1 Tax=Desulfofarcimen acetoxidans (strain ATCC 49208 / DSM 771 / KCTC 5769 / VKM B-1644 / 5575) TaxID=485916 RepID=C8VVM7_DESAS|nr:hypothetical protein [Desulfofarcimen acetoxidans]ACV62342.1 hypothetical protein Dtox_1478 [Desulfofarcimen acetoxidans DSM 771]
MSEKALFTQEDCLQTGYDMSINGRVVILKASTLSEEFRESKHQLYFCTGGFGSNSNPSGRSVFAVSLADGEQVRWNRSDILGIAKPEILSDHARLQLSQIRPSGALDLKSHEPQYSGYCFLPDGRYTSGVWLCSPKEAQDYIDMQKDYQHRMMICDRDDFCVFEMVDGKLIHPSPEVLEALKKDQQEPGGMELKL